MTSIVRLLAVAAPIVLLKLPLQAVTPESPISLTQPSLGMWDADWEGISGRTYFFQWSFDMQDWHYMPTIDYGTGPKHCGFSSTSDRYFVRLQQHFIPSSDPEGDDYDFDGLSNIDEVTLHDTNPLDWDTDGDSLPDDWEIENHLDPRDDGSIDPDNGAFGDPDEDELLNKDEYWYWCDPHNPDTDGDGLTDGDEVWVYGTSPFWKDSDDDGLSDYDEIIIHQTLPWVVDTDEDGVSDADEVRDNTDPNDAEDFSFRWVHVTRELTYDYDDYPPPNDKGALDKFANWDSASNTHEDLAGPIPFPDLGGRLEMLTFPATPPFPGRVIGLATSDGASKLIPDDPCYHATMNHHRFWLQRGTADSTFIVRNAILVTKRTVDGVEQAPTSEVKTFTIPADATHSNSIDLHETFTTDFSDNMQHSESFSQILLPVEAVNSDNVQLSKLKVAKMIEFGVLNSNRKLIPSNDSDCFRIRIKGGASLGEVSIKVSTANNPETRYNDDSTQIELTADDGDAISKKMILVSDDEDDEHPIDNIEDNDPNDVSHMIQLGGDFVIDSIKIGDAVWQSIQIKFPVPVVKTVTITPVIIRDKPLADGGVQLVPYETVAEHIRIMKERFAQVGVKIEFSTVELKDPPPGVDLSDGLTLTRPSGELVSEEAKKLIEKWGTTETTDIHIFYVNSLHALGSGILRGLAFTSYTMPEGFEDYSYNAFVSTERTNGSIPVGGIVAAHELAHLLRNAGHAGSVGDVPDTQLMIEYTSTDGVMGSKRLSNPDEALIQGNTHAY